MSPDQIGALKGVFPDLHRTLSQLYLAEVTRAMELDGDERHVTPDLDAARTALEEALETIDRLRESRANGST
jgi:hypothetical protein